MSLGRVLWPFALVAALMLISGVLTPTQADLGSQIMLFAIAAVGYNVCFSNAGQFHVGAPAFLGTGAFVALGCAKLGLPLLVAVLGGAVAAGALGVLIGIPSLRLAGVYLIITTLALNFIMLFVFTLVSGSHRGGSGFKMPGDADLFGYHLGNNVGRWFLVLSVPFVAVIWITQSLLRAHPGRAWHAMAQHLESAAAMGVATTRWRLGALGYSAFLFGLVGGLTAYYADSVYYRSFIFAVAITYVVMILFGGLGSILGSVMGAAAVTLLPYALTQLFNSDWLGSPALIQEQANIVSILYGVVIVLVLIAEPSGLAGLAKRAWRAVARRRETPTAGSQPVARTTP